MLLILFHLLFAQYNTEDLCIQLCRGEQIDAELISGLDPDQLAYKGAFTCISAENAWNPLTKLQLFEEGTELINEAIFRAPNAFHPKFCRYLIQYKSPGFLFYSGELESDRIFLQRYYMDNSGLWGTQLYHELTRVFKEIDII